MDGPRLLFFSRQALDFVKQSSDLFGRRVPVFSCEGQEARIVDNDVPTFGIPRSQQYGGWGMQFHEFRQPNEVTHVFVGDLRHDSFDTSRVESILKQSPAVPPNIRIGCFCSRLHRFREG